MCISVFVYKLWVSEPLKKDLRLSWKLMGRMMEFRVRV